MTSSSSNARSALALVLALCALLTLGGLSFAGGGMLHVHLGAAGHAGPGRGLVHDHFHLGQHHHHAQPPPGHRHPREGRPATTEHLAHAVQETPDRNGFGPEDEGREHGDREHGGREHGGREHGEQEAPGDGFVVSLAQMASAIPAPVAIQALALPEERLALVAGRSYHGLETPPPYHPRGPPV